jgi:hypothetical protein
VWEVALQDIHWVAREAAASVETQKTDGGRRGLRDGETLRECCGEAASGNEMSEERNRVEVTGKRAVGPGESGWRSGTN